MIVPWNVMIERKSPSGAQVGKEAAVELSLSPLDAKPFERNSGKSEFMLNPQVEMIQLVLDI